MRQRQTIRETVFTFARRGLVTAVLLYPLCVTVAQVRFSKVGSDRPVEYQNATSDPLVALRNHRERLEYAAALRILDSLRRSGRISADLLVEYGALFLDAEEPERSAQYFDEALKWDTNHVPARIGRALADLYRRDYEPAESLIRTLLERSRLAASDKCKAHTALARILFETQRLTEAISEAEAAIRFDSGNADAVYLLAGLRATQGRPDAVRELARRAAELAPFKAGPYLLLARYLDSKTAAAPTVSKRAISHYEKARLLKSNRAFDRAADQLEAAIRIEPRFYRALISLGDISLRTGDYRRAGDLARRAVNVEPTSSLANLQLGCALAGTREQARAEIGCTDFTRRYYGRPEPKVDARSIKAIFRGFSRLNPRQRFVIAASVEPLSEFLPELVKSGAVYQLISYDQSPADVPGFIKSIAELAPDGRPYASMRGAGGKRAISGIEYLDQAARGGFNSIAHEFAHQVHLTALNRDHRNAVRELYRRAMRENRTLDYYASSDEYEYFAQGYEAFVSEFKRPSATLTGRHTREELARRDPALFHFFIELGSANGMKSLN